MAVVHVTKDTFKQEVLESQVPVLVDFWAVWCGPCQMVGPILDEIAQERTDIKVCKVNVDEEPDLAAEYRIMSIPAMYVFKNGEITDKSLGALPKEQILELL
ncbi:MAG: thioredoxin [Lachnospiraceae bacterium]|jgi:thioredoxin 1|nr:thioredoxin [Lachnospiraceae bacterium]MDD3615761.1 thioredoxin [Lachnospiraceae bacterium]